MRRIAIVTALIVATSVGAALAEERARDFLTDVRAYHDVAARVCDTGVTPEMTRLYVAAERALAEARYGAGVGSNFFGLKTPDEMYRNCFQSPGGGFM